VSFRHGGFVALASPPGGFWRTPADQVEQAPHMPRVIGTTKFQTDDGSDPTAGPEFSAKAVGGWTAMQQLGQAGELLGRQPPRSPGWRPTPESLGTNVAGPCHLLTDRALADPQSLGNLPLRPALLLEGPGLESSGFVPVVRSRVHA
jgi:hypothetical protein